MAKRIKQKLILTDDEISLIKGLIEHTELNDQMIVAMFSHASRTINHREIGYFRDPNNKKYASKPASSKAEVEHFLARYGRFERIAKQMRLLPQETHFQRVQKASEAMKSAVATFNNPTITWKSEIFIVNAIIAWTYLLHAYYQTNEIYFIYKKNGNPLTTDDGRPKHWELTKCLDAHECPLPEAAKSNLRYLITVRNEIEHRLSDNVDPLLQPKIQACAINFNHWMCKWFGNAHSIAEELAFAIQFAEISIPDRNDIIGRKGLPAVIQAVNNLIESKMTSDEYNDPQYSYRVYVIPKTTNNPRKADQAVTYAHRAQHLKWQ